MKKTNFRFLLYFTLVLCSIGFIMPVLFIFITSLGDMTRGLTIFPDKLHFENYFYALVYIPFWQYFKSSLIICVISLVFSVTASLVYGFAFARLHAPGKNLLFSLCISTLMIPGIATQIPQYIMYSKMGLRDTYWIWVIVGMAGNAYLVFLFRQYFSSIPKEIEEAGIIDGCSTFGLLTRIFIPISKSVIVVAMVLSLQWTWNDYSMPFMYLSEDKFTLALGMIFRGYTIPNSPDIPLMPLRSCGAIILSIPVLVIFFIAQKYLREGIVAGAVKG